MIGMGTLLESLQCASALSKIEAKSVSQKYFGVQKMDFSVRYFLFTILLSTCLFTKHLNAEESDQAAPAEQSDQALSTDQTDERERVQQVEQTINSDSSSTSARLNKKASVEGRLGFIVAPISGTGVGAFFHVNQNLHVGISHVSGTYDFSDDVDAPEDTTSTMEQADLKASLTQVFARYFVGNSFYLSGGLGQRKVQADLDVRSTVFDHRINGSIKADSTVLNVSIGNAWSWDNGFFIGCEWVGLTVPLSNSNSGELTLSGTGVEEDAEFKKLKNDTEDVAELFGESTMASLLILHLGWAF
ncbi:MAG: hypothetical protein KBD78_00330 [Oligoflexales bacterium]|nr:hypothetical protein [Oligoflexales bacterium]